MVGPRGVDNIIAFMLMFHIYIAPPATLCCFFIMIKKTIATNNKQSLLGLQLRNEQKQRYSWIPDELWTDIFNFMFERRSNSLAIVECCQFVLYNNVKSYIRSNNIIFILYNWMPMNM